MIRWTRRILTAISTLLLVAVVLLWGWGWTLLQLPGNAELFSGNGRTAFLYGEGTYYPNNGTPEDFRSFYYERARGLTVVSIANWTLAVVFALLPSVTVARRCRDRRRIRLAKHGLCTVCGYDLRGTNGACPECGHTD